MPPDATAEAARVAIELALKRGGLPVQQQGLSANGVGIWIIVAYATVYSLLALVKAAPQLYAKWAERDGQIRGETAVKKQSTEQRFAALEDRVGRTQNAIGFLTNAVITATQALDSHSDEDRKRAKKNALELVAMAAKTLGKDDPFTGALNQLAENVVSGIVDRHP